MGLFLRLGVADLERIKLSEQLPQSQSQSHSQLNIYMGQVMAAWLKEEAEDQVRKQQLIKALQSMREHHFALELEKGKPTYVMTTTLQCIHSIPPSLQQVRIHINIVACL